MLLRLPPPALNHLTQDVLECAGEHSQLPRPERAAAAPTLLWEILHVVSQRMENVARPGGWQPQSLAASRQRRCMRKSPQRRARRPCGC